MSGSDMVTISSGSGVNIDNYTFDNKVATTPFITSQLVGSARTNLFKVNTIGYCYSQI